MTLHVVCHLLPARVSAAIGAKLHLPYTGTLQGYHQSTGCVDCSFSIILLYAGEQPSRQRTSISLPRCGTNDTARHPKVDEVKDYALRNSLKRPLSRHAGRGKAHQAQHQVFLPVALSERQRSAGLLCHWPHPHHPPRRRRHRPRPHRLLRLLQPGALLRCFKPQCV